MRIIAIIGPYTSLDERQRDRNIDAGKRIGLELLMLGYAVHCPWLDSGFADVEPLPGLGKIDIFAPEMIKKLQANTQEFIKRLIKTRDGVLVIGDYQRSIGAIKDLTLARMIGLRIFYEDELSIMLRELPPETW